MVYITISDFETFTRTTYDSDTDPTSSEVQQALDVSNAEVELLTGRTWSNGNHVEVKFYPSNRFTLRNTPVDSINSVVDKDSKAVKFEQFGDLVEIEGQVPKKLTIDYEGGPTEIPADVKMLVILYTLEKLMQGQSAGESSAESISIGSLSITKNLGASFIYNLDKNIKKYEKSVTRMVY